MENIGIYLLIYLVGLVVVYVCAKVLQTKNEAKWIIPIPVISLFWIVIVPIMVLIYIYNVISINAEK